ncbi:GNAT family N-acetyltransferase [Clostridium sp. 19966]|nr:GNAT family N-acetyltransferase [Clostridium sp. 19966]
MAANKFYFVNGSVELLEFVEPLWYKLNKHHEEKSNYFKERYRNFKFENRKNKLLLGDMLINIDLIKKEKAYVGYCISSINKEHIGEIESIYIEEEYRKYGLGDSLMKRALKWLEEKGAKSKMIGVAEGNDEVLEFYKKYGFYKRTTILQQK